MIFVLAKKYRYFLLILCTWTAFYIVCKHASFLSVDVQRLYVHWVPKNSKRISTDKTADTYKLGSSLLAATVAVVQGNTELACHLPKLNPFDKSIMKYVRNPPQIDCSTKHPLIFTTDLDSNLVKLQDPSKYGFYNCCYQPFKRKPGSERKIMLFPECLPIENTQTLIPIDFEFIRVLCSKPHFDIHNHTLMPPDKRNPKISTDVVDVFGMVHLKPLVEENIQNRLASIDLETKTRVQNSMESVKERKWKDKKLNVILFGLDAVSHMNFIRIMPLTHKYLRQNLSAIGFNGYVKIGENTFPNLVALLSGHSAEEIHKTCWKYKGKPFDNCQFIWKKFAAQGYRTAYSEDAVHISTFNYQKPGFRDPPTDYYFNTFLRHLQYQMGHHKLVNTHYCYGPRSGPQVSMKFLQQMAYTMNKTRPYFQFAWTNAATHDDLNYGRLEDAALFETLQWFTNSGYLENTVLILTSDHGLRWGSLRPTYQGRIEERMPFLYIILPKAFQNNYPQAYSNMIGNQNKMSTPFDLHETLLDILELKKIYNNVILKRTLTLSEGKRLPRGISLFLPVPARRTCKDARIPDHYCVCAPLVSIPVENNTIVKEAAGNVVADLNSMLAQFSECATLSLGKVINAQLVLKNPAFHHSRNATWSKIYNTVKTSKVTFSVSILVLPSNGTFEATTTRLVNGTWEISGRVSRTNFYGNESWCANDAMLKMYCYCKELVLDNAR